MRSRTGSAAPDEEWPRDVRHLDALDREGSDRSWPCVPGKDPTWADREGQHATQQPSRVGLGSAPEHTTSDTHSNQRIVARPSGYALPRRAPRASDAPYCLARQLRLGIPAISPLRRLVHRHSAPNTPRTHHIPHPHIPHPPHLARSSSLHCTYYHSYLIPNVSAPQPRSPTHIRTDREAAPAPAASTHRSPHTPNYSRRGSTWTQSRRRCMRPARRAAQAAHRHAQSSSR